MAYLIRTTEVYRADDENEAKAVSGRLYTSHACICVGGDHTPYVGMRRMKRSQDRGPVGVVRICAAWRVQL